MATEWVTSEALKRWLSPPFTADEEQNITDTVNAVNSFIAHVRPDLEDPPPAFSAEFGEGFAAMYPHICRAALDLARRWYEKRGMSQTSSFSELGFIPASIDRDIEAALEIGYHHNPVIA